MIELKKITVLFFITMSVCGTHAFDGILDRSYAQGKQLYEELPVCKAVATQSDGKMLVAGYVEQQGKKVFAVARLLQNGMLDYSFGKNGVTQTYFSNGETASSAQAVMIDIHGRIVAGGFTNGIGNMCHACLARYNTDGSLDKSFFGGRSIFKGTVITTFGSLEGMSHINGLSETKEQKIVAVGSMFENKCARFAIAQYNPNGSLDVSFNAKGVGSACGTVCTQFDLSTNDEACAVTIDAHDKILVAGSSYATGIKTFALARYHKDGSLDQSFFGGNTALHGTVVTNFMCGETEGSAHAVRVQADGKIVAAGYTNAFCSGQKRTHFALARYTAQGMLDIGFGSNNRSAIPGTIVTNFGDEKMSSAVNALLIQTDGKIVAGGCAEYNNAKYFALARYESSGFDDYSFNSGGALSGRVLSRSSVQNNDEIFGLSFAVQGDIVAVGRSKGGALSYGAVARYMCDQEMNCPEITVPACDAKIVDASNLILKGTAHNMSSIIIYLDGKKLDILKVANNNSWQHHLPALVDGEHQLQVVECYENGNAKLESKKYYLQVDQHPKAMSQMMDCHGTRLMEGFLAAQGASGEYSFKIIKENNCKVILDGHNGPFKVQASMPHGSASFDFEVEDVVNKCASQGTVSLEVRDIPLAGSARLDIGKNNQLEGNLNSFTMGGQEPYLFSLLDNNEQCDLNPNGSFIITPKFDFLGKDEIKFIATDRYKVSSDPGCLSFHVHPLPQANEQVMHQYSNVVITGDLSLSTVAGRKPCKYSLHSQMNCQVTIDTNGVFSCVPDQDLIGQISFEYVITDGYGIKSNPCQVMIQLHEVLAFNPSLIICCKDAPIFKNLGNFVSHAHNECRYILEKDVEHGSLKVSETGILEFMPHKGYIGQVECCVKIGSPELPESIMQVMNLSIIVKEAQELETAIIPLYQGCMDGTLQKHLNKDSKCYLIYCLTDARVDLKTDGEFKLDGVSGNDPIGFIYKEVDALGNEEIKNAQVNFVQEPMALSDKKIAQANQELTGNLQELAREGIPPYTYKIVSAKNGKIKCKADGKYSFNPRFDLYSNAEFTYQIIDSNNIISNVGKIEFCLLQHVDEVAIDSFN